MMVEQTFTCPECGKTWVELQNPKDDWFGCALNQTLCNDCGAKAVRRALMDMQKKLDKVHKKLKEEKQ